MALNQKRVEATTRFDAYFQSLPDKTREQIKGVEEKLIGIKSDEQNLRKERQPLRVGMQMTEIRRLICNQPENEPEKAKPQTAEGKAWGSYKLSYLQAAGYSRASIDNYINQTAAAREIIPDDNLLSALLDEEKLKDGEKTGVVLLIGGSVKKPFAKYTSYLKTEMDKLRTPDGKVELEDLDIDNFVAQVFEHPETTREVDFAVKINNYAMKQIFANLRKDDGVAKPTKENPQVDEKLVIEAAQQVAEDVFRLMLNRLGFKKAQQFTPYKNADIDAVENILTIRRLVQDQNSKVSTAKAVAPKANNKVSPKAAKAVASKAHEGEGIELVTRPHRKAASHAAAG